MMRSFNLIEFLVLFALGNGAVGRLCRRGSGTSLPPPRHWCLAPGSYSPNISSPPSSRQCTKSSHTGNRRTTPDGPLWPEDCHCRLDTPVLRHYLGCTLSLHTGKQNRKKKENGGGSFLNPAGDIYVTFLPLALSSLILRRLNLETGLTQNFLSDFLSLSLSLSL